MPFKINVTLTSIIVAIIAIYMKKSSLVRILVLIAAIVGMLGTFLFEESYPKISFYIRMIAVSIGTIGILILNKMKPK